MENPNQVDPRVEELRKSINSLTTEVVTHLNKINRLLREIQQPKPKMKRFH